MIRTKGQRYAMIDAARQFVYRPSLAEKRAIVSANAGGQRRKKTLGGVKSFHM